MTTLCTTIDSMLHLHQTLVLCFWCLLLLHRQALADEEAGWGPTPSHENQPGEKTSWLWTSLTKLPSLPSLSFPIPFYGSLNSNDKAAAVTTTAEGHIKASAATTDHLQSSGPGEVNTSEAAERPTASTQGLLASVTRTERTESPPTETSDSPKSSQTQRDNDSPVSNSYSHTSRPITNTLFADSAISTFAPEQNATRTHPPWGPARGARPSMGVTARHPPDDDKAEDSADEISTIAPETTVPTAVTWAAAQTRTTEAGLAETTLNKRHFLERVTASASLETTHSPVSTTPHPGEDTVTENHSTQNDTGLGLDLTGAISQENDHELEITTSTSQSQTVPFPIAGGKQS